MTREERAEILLTARLLRASSNLDWLVTGWTILAAASLFWSDGTEWNRAAAFAAILLGLIGKLQAFRVSFDARLLADVAADRIGTEDLDAALAKLGVGAPKNPGRPWPDRCRGARRLVIKTAAVALAQTVAIVLIAMAGPPF